MISSTLTPGIEKYLNRHVSGYFSNDLDSFKKLSKCTKGVLEDIKDDCFLYNNQRFKFFMPLPTWENIEMGD